MSYYIPSDKQVEHALKKVLTRFRTIPSQNRLKDLVTNALTSKKKEYGVSAKRLRTIALKTDFVQLEIHSREGDPQKVLTRCPVCGTLLKRVKNLTIWGGEVTLEFQCPFCKYWTGKKKRIPTRYVFHLNKSKKGAI